MTEQVALQEELDAFLAYAVGDVLLWHDAAGFWEQGLGKLVLPADVELVCEGTQTPYALKIRVNSVAPDERLLVYRRCLRGVCAGDWLADIEARAPQFSSGSTFLSFEPSSSFEREDTSGLSAAWSAGDLLAGDIADSVPAGQLEDWYTHEDFLAVVGEKYPAFAGLSAEEVARDLGFLVYVDCVLRLSAGGLRNYYASFFKGELVQRSQIPQQIASADTFKRYVEKRLGEGTLFVYDAESWMTPAGLLGLGTSAEEAAAFASRLAVELRVRDIRIFTVALLKRELSDFDLLGYGLADEFYDCVLSASSDVFKSARVCGSCVYSLPEFSPKGRDVVRMLVEREGTAATDDLLETLQNEYGLDMRRAQLNQLARSAGLYVQKDMNEIYLDREQFKKQFLEEME